MATAGALPAQPSEPPHGRRIIVIWAVTSVVGVLLVVFLLGPHLPPGNLSAEARDQRHINTLLCALATPVLLGVWIFFVYSLRSFRVPGGVIEDGPPLMGDARIQVLWVATTAAIVLALAAYGTAELLGTAKGAGGGQGPDPLAVPANSKSALQIQVIGQQWAWTFRYPQYGGFETTHLGLPAGRLVEFHVTSLDVIHSFWAYQLGVKADAFPGNDNVAFATARYPGKFEVRCAELCGLWHGHMHLTGQVLSPSAFPGWVAGERAANGRATKALPPYSSHYFPAPFRRAG